MRLTLLPETMKTLPFRDLTDTATDESKAPEEKERQDWMDAHFAELLAEAPQKGKSMVEIVGESRGNY